MLLFTTHFSFSQNGQAPYCMLFNVNAPNYWNPNVINDFSNGTISNKTYAINGTFTVNSNLTITNSHLYFASDAKLIIESGYKLTIDNNSILEAC